MLPAAWFPIGDVKSNCIFITLEVKGINWKNEGGSQNYSLYYNFSGSLKLYATHARLDYKFTSYLKAPQSVRPSSHTRPITVDTKACLPILYHWKKMEIKRNYYT